MTLKDSKKLYRGYFDLVLLYQEYIRTDVIKHKEAYLAEQEAKGTGIDRPGTETGGITLPTTSGGSGFYFYNPQAVSQGKAAFQRKMGTACAGR